MMTQRELVYIIITAILCMLLGGFVSNRYFCPKCDEPSVGIIVDTVYYARPDTVTLLERKVIYKRDTTKLVETRTLRDTIVERDTMLIHDEPIGFRYVYKNEYEEGVVMDTLSVVNSTIVDKRQSLAVYHKTNSEVTKVSQHRILAGAFYHINEKNASFGLSFQHKRGYVASLYKPVTNNTIMVGLSAPIISWPK